MKQLQKKFYLNGNTIGFHPQTEKLNPHTKYIVSYKRTAEVVSLECDAIGFRPRSDKNLIVT